MITWSLPHEASKCSMLQTSASTNSVTTKGFVVVVAFVVVLLRCFVVVLLRCFVAFVVVFVVVLLLF